MSGPSSPSLRSESSSTSPSLINRLKRNELDAWQRLVELYTPLVCYWCGRAKLGHEDTEEITQETFWAVHAGIGGFRHQSSGDTFRGWLRTIAGNKIRDFQRRANRTPEAVGGSAALRWIEGLAGVIDEDETSVVQSLFQRALRPIEDKFEAQTWQAFLLVVVDELTPEMAAERLGTTPGAIRTARWRVLQELRRELGDDQ